MPIYEFICENCKTEQEVICKISEVNKVACSKCGSLSMIKKTSLSDFTLKGGGWYKDGYTKEKAPKADKK